MKHTTLGILAHVDAGKTTTCEMMMFSLKKLKNFGRVDKKNTFLDTDTLEKEHGITIFSKQAVISLGDTLVTLLDTPGHVDFFAEAWRTLSVLDAAILIISAPEGIQSHTRTIWRMLKYYNIPVFIFINKMDMDGVDKACVFNEIKAGLSESCVDFSMRDESFYEDIASLDENLLNKYLAGFPISDSEISHLIYDRTLFPVFFGSALKNEGIDVLLEGLSLFLLDYSAIHHLEENDTSLGARVFKISRDDKEERISHVKLTSGSLSVRDMIDGEKITGIRKYDGEKYESVNTVSAGEIAALTGLKNTYEGQGIGENESDLPLMITPVISYELVLPDDINKSEAVAKLLKLSDEQPDLMLSYDSEAKSITISLMGEIQTEIIKKKIFERFGFNIEFADKKILYKETIQSTVEGVGHFEPLRHYAEVHLIMEPLPLNSGLIFETNVSEDLLDKNWQRLILTHLKEKTHIGVLTGSPITDMKITVAGGRAHIKHTEGGDFRQATYRAVRHGLMQAKCQLLEPYYSFELLIPSDCVGRAMTDFNRLHAKEFTPEAKGDYTLIRGTAPVSTMFSYGNEVLSYTKGLGSLSLSVEGYGPCHNEAEIIEKCGYNAEGDVKNTADSVFCSHGSSIIIPWSEVKNNMHVPSVLTPVKELTDEQIRLRAKIVTKNDSPSFISTEEAAKIVESTVSANRKPEFIAHKGINRPTVNNKTPDEVKKSLSKPKPVLPEYILVDGYNVIYADAELSDIARNNIDGARHTLLDILSDFKAMKGVNIIAVFDAYRLKNHPEEFTRYNNINVVYTKTAQTADYYIMRFTKENRTKYRILVATSDNVEQVIVRGENTTVVSSKDFLKEIRDYRKNFNELHGVK